jgi:hypothetical protein
MAKSPQKPTKAKSTSKTVDKAHDAIYTANQAAIDTALDQCVRHLKKLEIEVARETIRRLEAHYLKHGTSGPGNFGRKPRPLI